MEIKVRYQKGVLRPLHKIMGIKEGEVLNVIIERHEWNKLAMHNPSFNFLKNEPNIYSKVDIIKNK